MLLYVLYKKLNLHICAFAITVPNIDAGSSHDDDSDMFVDEDTQAELTGMSNNNSKGIKADQRSSRPIKGDQGRSKWIKVDQRGSRQIKEDQGRSLTCGCRGVGLYVGDLP